MNILDKHYVEVDLQNPNQYKSLPDLADIKIWCKAGIQKKVLSRAYEKRLSLVIRVVNNEESADLNMIYRNKSGPTNVLSYPNEIDDFMLDIPELKEQNSHIGDLVICEPLLRKEAVEQNKTPFAHWAHLIVHGVLHLQGFDHVDDDEAEKMESLEISILEKLGFANPYQAIS